MVVKVITHIFYLKKKKTYFHFQKHTSFFFNIHNQSEDRDTPMDILETDHKTNQYTNTGYATNNYG